MAEIIYDDEFDLQRKIVKILNKSGFYFKKAKANYFCDLIDKINKIYVEVKPDFFSPAQILYGMAKNKIEDAKYIGLACAFEIRFYIPPSFRAILDFAKSIDPDLKMSPSSITKQLWQKKAFELLGIHDFIYTYKGKLNLDDKKKTIFINKDNYEYFRKIFDKYNINPARFLTYIADIYSKNQEITINNEGKILNKNTGKFFRNSDNRQQTLNDIDYRPIKNFRDKTLLEFTRIKPSDIQEILHQIDRLEPIGARRIRGRYFTKGKLGREISDIVKQLSPQYIIEPYVGSGSLIDSLVGDYTGAMNDINDGFIKILRKQYEGYNWIFTSLNVITTPINELIIKWNIPIDKTILIITNPPFGTASTNKLASKKDEINRGGSRKKKIEYGGLGDKYGRGDLLIPAIAKLIELVKYIKKGYLSFFAPAGVFCGRKRYNKLLNALLKDFEFLEGYIFSGEHFNSISKKKPITFTIWKYNKNINTVHESLEFNYEGKNIQLKKLPLLKDFWKYDNRKNILNEIAVQGCDRFNAATPKIFHMNVKKGGSEIIYANIKKAIKLSKIPDELFFGLWSVTVGYKSITNFPIYINEAYTHLPNFNMTETFEILAYVIIHIIISEEIKHYCNNKIGFIGTSRIFKFGGKRLTDGAKYLIDTYGYCKIGDKTIKEVFLELKNEPDITKINNNYRKIIKKEIENRLEKIGYWDYIPIP